MRHLIPRLLIVLGGVVSLPHHSHAQSRVAVDSAFFRQEWASAASGYQSIARKDSTDGTAWFRLGIAEHALHHGDAAMAAYLHAEGLNFQTVSVEYRIARLYALRGDSRNAAARLDSAVTLAGGGLAMQQVTSEADFASVRDDAAFKKVLMRMDAMRYPCHSMPQASQFDFWIGQWDVRPWDTKLAAAQAAAGQPAGFNDVHPILEHCIVFENWKGPNGGEGKSFNYYDTNLSKWRQIWMSDGGGALDYTGEYRDGAMRFEGWTLNAQGGKVLQKLTFFNIAPDTVRQQFEASSDGGKTWQTTFDGRYVRRHTP